MAARVAKERGYLKQLNYLPYCLWFTLINPVRWFMVIIRGLYLKGVGLQILWKQFLMLAAIGAAVLGVAVVRFRKNIG